MAVKLDVLVNYLFDNSKLKANIASLNKQMIAAWSPFTGFTNKSLLSSQALNLRERFSRINVAARQFNDIMENTLKTVKEMNKEGLFADYLKSMGLRRKKLKPEEEKYLAREATGQQISEIQANAEETQIRFEQNIDEFMNLETEIFKAELKAKKEKEKIQQRLAQIQEKSDLKDIEEKSRLEAKLEQIKERKQADYWLAKIKWEKEIAKKQQIEDEKQKKKFFNLMLGRWGKFGLWGIAVAKAIQYTSKAMNYAYQTSMQGLDWQRTISGGASGGTWFGQGLAAYQRAGISANAYQGFKRGIQGYMGSVKLGMGNAAPLMYLGISALEDLDKTEIQIEQALRKLPDQVSLALAQQMGLSYEMWHAIYTGKLDRERDAYSKEAIEKWSKLADGFNEILTKIKTIFFNRGSVIAGEAGEALSAMAGGGVGYRRALQTGSPVFMRSMLDLPGAIASSLIKFGAVEVVVRNEQGEVLGKGESYADVGMQVPRQGS